jgi:flagellar basal body-associated protein FliL
MKQKDIVLIIVVAFVSAVAALVLSNFLFGSPSRSQQKAEVVDPITANFQAPDRRYFNKDSIDPTQTITIGNGQTNQTPFNQPSQ